MCKLVDHNGNTVKLIIIGGSISSAFLKKKARIFCANWCFPLIFPAINFEDLPATLDSASLWPPALTGPCLSLAPFDGGRILDTKPAISWVYIDLFNWDRIIVYVI